MTARATEEAQGREGERGSRRGSTAALYTLLSVMFINMLGFGIVVPLLPFYGASFHAAPWQIALIFSAYSMGSFWGEPFWGKLSDRIGRKPVLVWTLLANCACYGLLAFAPNIFFAFVIRFFGGMAAGNGSVVQGYLADVTPPEERAGRISRIGAAYNLGFILGPAVGGFLAKPSMGTRGFQIPLLAASALAACAALGVTLLVRESRARKVRGPQPSRWVMLGYAVRHPVVGPLLGLTLAVGFAFSGIESVFPLWAHHRFNWQPRQVGFVFALSALIASPTQFFLTGALSKRFGEGPMLAIGMVGATLSFVLQPLIGDGGVITYGLMAAMALFTSAAFPNSGALISRSIDEDNQGQIMGLANAAGALARFIGPQSMAFAFSAAVNAPYFLGAAVVGASIFLALAASRAAGRLYTA
ncbi:MAG TPA: MFS transporter [Caulobacteraceae bacterium]|jgi:MFS family permease|nr:MFS transporter [Caulobacteraceae bacterium]